MSAAASSAEGAALERAMPVVFVLIWSTGFVVAHYAMAHAPTLSFLSLRYALSIACFALWAALARAAWPRGVDAWKHLAVSGVLMHAVYLGGVWGAVRSGIGAGTVAPIVGLQPLLTALWIAQASGIASRIGARQWLGLVLGFVGLVLVVWDRLGAGELSPLNCALAVGALASITIGTLYQKRYVAAVDVRTASCVQLAAALVVSAPLALLEAEPVTFHPELIGALAWSVLVLTLAGSSLLMLLLQRGAATRVASLMYLVPPCTALLAAALFGEPLGALLLSGFAISALGVWLVLRAL